MPWERIAKKHPTPAIDAKRDHHEAHNPAHPEPGDSKNRQRPEGLNHVYLCVSLRVLASRRKQLRDSGDLRPQLVPDGQ